MLSGSEVAPHVDWDAIVHRVENQEESRPGESVPSRVLLLAEGWAVALSDAADGTVHVVEPELDGPKRIQELRISQLEAGDFVLLRSQGSGSLVVDVANAELGRRANDLRAAQQRWKDALRARVNTSGPSAVSRELRRLGGHRANDQNLRNWMSPRSLRTADRDDFLAILKLVGLESEMESIWGSMELLEQAHRRAGFRIRRMLIDVVANAELEPLEVEGILNFELADQDGGSLTAYRVEGIAPSMVQVNEHRLGRPVDAEDLWLG
jgi:hypothetical protein